MQKWNFTLILGLLLVVAAVNFFFNLGSSSLVSWDEAWYGVVAKNIIHSGDLLRLTFNGQPYYDHPPAGFWLIALSMRTFGNTEFGVRAASAVCALLTILVVYLLGRRLFHASVGLAAGLALLSSPWFTLRARSGDLDIFLTLFFVLTFYLALETKTHRRIFPFFLVSLCLLFLTKSGIPFTILPVLLYLFRFRLRYFFLSLLTPVIILALWLAYQPPGQLPPLLQYFLIGLPGIKTGNNYLSNVSLIKSYLHFGIGDLFRPAVISLPFGPFFSASFIPLLIFLVSFITPFFFSAKGQIWHLIPAFPFLALCFTGLVYTLLAKFRLRLASLVTIVITFLIVLPQLNRNWRDFISVPAYVSDEAILSKAAANYSLPLYIDEDFTPAAVYYSDKLVTRLNIPSLLPIFSSPTRFILITHEWRLTRDSVPPATYQILKKDRDRVLVLH